MATKRRVVVTGLGAVTPLGNTRETFWDSLIAGRSGVAKITAFDASPLGAQIAAEVKGFDPDALIGRRDARRLDRYAQFAIVAADEALADAGLPEEQALRDGIGAIIGTGIGGIHTTEQTTMKVAHTNDITRVSPFFVPMLMANAAPAHISMKYRLRGPLYAISSACASANDAIAAAYVAIVRGDAEAMVTGGAEATVLAIAVGGFDTMKALSTRNDQPERASRPFDRERDGFVLGEGAAIIILEERELAMRRGAHIYAEMLGYGQSADAHNLVAPDPAGGGVILALRRALESAGVQPSDVDYVNAHGTSTPIGDPAESKALEIVFGEAARRVAVSSTKSMHGHLLGAAGAVEGVATILAVCRDIMPPTINYEFPDPECRLDYVPNVARRAPVRVAMSNAFGFGGHNGVVVFGKHLE
ncbi:MAG: beta-ketoacyl-ACP synthase II [Candidatus Eremiobacteraeota bacterium]|nr:beta-ketoacyl-ACP synthase II [Candidatus Eremiobacteraeota bacterium]